ncbi:hypothetical protein F4604DRAFT_1928000 [Suillus subluteus]|nr:hypothetical protein F4604DRAFT_1928000 [Suillus subluteus]
MRGMAGVIALCATALECAVTLIEAGDIKVENILASTMSHNKLNIKLPKVLNKVTGKETSAPYLFSRNLWGKAFNGYMKGISKKDKDFIEMTVEMVQLTMNESATGDADDESSDDNRCHAWYVIHTMTYTQQQ